MYFTIKKTKNVTVANIDDNGDSLLILVDILTVDSQSRVTFTHHLKKKLGILPYDKIIVYPEQHNNNNEDKSMIFKVK